MRKLNEDSVRRFEIIKSFIHAYPEPYTHESDFLLIDDVNKRTIKKLVEENFVDLDDRQNDSPRMRELIDFVYKFPQFKLFGYVIGPKRPDYRITFDGIIYQGKRNLSIKTQLEFVKKFGQADEFKVERNYCRAWWD